MNELVARSFGGVEAANAYKAALRRSTANISQGGDDTPILKIDKVHGDWSFGEDNTPVQRDDLWAVHPLDIKHGYIAFDGSAVAEDMDGQRAEMLFPVTHELPRYDELPELDIRSRKKKGDNDGKWQFQMVLRMVCVEGGNKGAEVVYKPLSQGGLRMVGKLSAEILRAMDEADDGAFVPVIELDNRPYESRSYGPQQQPLAHIVEFITLDTKTFASGRTEVADDAPATKSKGKADSGGGKRDSGRGGDRDAAREDARERRAAEKSAKGDAVDQRRRRDADDVVDDRVDGEPEAPRGRRATHDDGKTARRGPAPREHREREEPVDDAPAPRGRRARDEDVAEEPEAPRGRRAARADDEAPRADEDAPRGRRRERDEDERPARAADAPRGRNAERGGRSRRD